MKYPDIYDYEYFENEVKTQHRYILSKEGQDFLHGLIDEMNVKSENISKDTRLFRSQLGFIEEYDEGTRFRSCYEAERMIPLKHQAKEGRINPKGIPVLYLSDNAETSMAELRPSVGDFVSCGTFRIRKELVVVDCYSNTRYLNSIQRAFADLKNKETMSDVNWSYINDAFAKPVTNTDESAEYVPTQIIANLIQSRGFDGICFKSSLSDGKNFSLFDLDSAEFETGFVMKVDSIIHNFSDATEWRRF
jgi:hypothetical protein